MHVWDGSVGSGVAGVRCENENDAEEEIHGRKVRRVRAGNGSTTAIETYNNAGYTTRVCTQRHCGWDPEVCPQAKVWP